MEALDNIRTRRSIRRFTDVPVTAQEIAAVIGDARLAPSWKNSQTARYIVITDKALKDRIAASITFSKNRLNIEGAAALVVLCTRDGIAGYDPDGTPTTSKGSHWQSFDAGIACQTFCLAAWAHGLGTLIMGIFDEAAVRELAAVPEGLSVSALLAVGHPADHPDAPKRLPLEEIMTVRE